MTLSNAGLFRRYARIEDQMVRASMPVTSERDPEVFTNGLTVTVANRGTSRLVRPVPALTFTIGEAVRNV